MDSVHESETQPHVATLKKISEQFKNYTEMERICGLPRGTVSRVLLTGNEIRYQHIASIAKNTGCSLHWLLTGEGEPFPQSEPANQVDGWTEPQKICVQALSSVIEEVGRLLLKVQEDPALARDAVVQLRWLQQLLTQAPIDQLTDSPLRSPQDDKQ